MVGSWRVNLRLGANRSREKKLKNVVLGALRARQNYFVLRCCRASDDYCVLSAQ